MHLGRGHQQVRRRRLRKDLLGIDGEVGGGDDHCPSKLFSVPCTAEGTVPAADASNCCGVPPPPFFFTAFDPNIGGFGGGGGACGAGGVGVLNILPGP